MLCGERSERHTWNLPSSEHLISIYYEMICLCDVLGYCRIVVEIWGLETCRWFVFGTLHKSYVWEGCQGTFAMGLESGF